MKKLINWLISCLKAENGYRKLYFDECAKLNTEHEVYLVLPNAYNTLAEQKQKPVEMAKAIKAYCAERDNCESCALADESGLCATPIILDPCFWEKEFLGRWSDGQTYAEP